MFDFTKYKWISLLTLSGVLVSSGLVGVVPSQAAVLDVRNKAVMASLPKKSVSRSYVDIVREQFNWRSAVLSTMFVDVEPARTDTSKNVKATDGSTKKVEATSPKTEAKPKTVAPTPKAPVGAPVSRGGSPVDKIISRAYDLKGVPYVWGGTTTSGFDCSGFVQYVFRSVGISLPRTAEGQYNVGTPVSRGELRPGDLVFF